MTLAARNNLLKSLLIIVCCFQKNIGQVEPSPPTLLNLLSSPCLPAAFSDAFNFFPKDLDGNINLQNLEVLAKQLGISFDGQEAHKKLVCADADGECIRPCMDCIVHVKCPLSLCLPSPEHCCTEMYFKAEAVLELSCFRAHW